MQNEFTAIIELANGLWLGVRKFPRRMDREKLSKNRARVFRRQSHLSLKIAVKMRSVGFQPQPCANT